MQLLHVSTSTFMCEYARVCHRRQHLRLSVWLSSVETEAHRAVLTCNSDELCKSSMKLNLRLGPQHTHTHTRTHTHSLTLHSDGCPDNTWPWVYVCVFTLKTLTHSLSVFAVCVNMLTWSDALLLWFIFALMVWRVAWSWIYDAVQWQVGYCADMILYALTACAWVCAVACHSPPYFCMLCISPHPALLNNRTFPTITIILMATSITPQLWPHP